jgi:type I restriction enzyme S subunit
VKALKVARLDSIAEVRLGRQRSPKDHDGPQMRPYMRAANVGWEGWKLDDVKYMNFTDAEMSVYRLRQGDLLLGEASGSATEVGKPAIWDDAIEDCAFQNTLIRVRPRKAEPRYLLHYFKFLAGTGKFAARSRGVGINHLGSEALASWAVPVPPIEEQRRIAAILDKADELRANAVPPSPTSTPSPSRSSPTCLVTARPLTRALSGSVARRSTTARTRRRNGRTLG